MGERLFEDSMAETEPNRLPVWFVGQRWRIHPASDWFMRGITYGTVVTMGYKWITLVTDTGRKFRIPCRGFNRHVYMPEDTIG